jgi:2-polyprenyl-3-methyl-5-hydroxy-6-metoxy-1,4-benzoquinol methylase
MRGTSSSPDFESISIDEVRRYWDARPCNLRHSPKPIGTREYSEEVEARKYFVEPHILVFAEPQRWAGKKILEIGCGLGTDTISFARHGAQITAVELSEKSLSLARRRAELYGFQDRIRFYHGNAERLTDFLPVDSYDLIYSFGVIHHSPHPAAILEQLRHYCHPGTNLRIMVYHRHSWKVLWILLAYGKGRFWRWRKLIAQYSEAQTGCPITYTYSRREITALLRWCGFRVTHIFVDHIFPYDIRQYVQHKYVKVWYFRWLPKSVFRWLETHFGWHLCLTGTPINAGEYPFLGDGALKTRV